MPVNDLNEKPVQNFWAGFSFKMPGYTISASTKDIVIHDQNRFAEINLAGLH